MEWTATEDGDNLWVSNITPLSQSAKAGVVPGSMLIAFNGKDITNMGAPSIHEHAATVGLPLRITFRKPSSLNAPKNKSDFSVREKIVNACVKALKNPQTWDYNDNQKQAMCKKLGANPAEIASAIFLVGYIIEKERKNNDDMKMNNIANNQPIQMIQQPIQQPNIVYVQQPIPNNQIPIQQPIQQPPPVYQQQQQPQPLPGLNGIEPLPLPQQNGNNNPQQIMNGTPMGNNINNNNDINNNNNDSNEPDEPPPGNNDELDDLEARFAKLKQGL